MGSWENILFNKITIQFHLKHLSKIIYISDFKKSNNDKRSKLFIYNTPTRIYIIKYQLSVEFERVKRKTGIE